jgi:hypothetical protein
MADDQDGKRYLVLIQLKGDSTMKRIAEDVRKIMEYLKGFSRGEQELAFKSKDGLLFGVFLKTASPQFLQAEFLKCPGTQNGDGVMAFEVGKLIAGTEGFSRAWTWLQRH